MNKATGIDCEISAKATKLAMIKLEVYSLKAFKTLTPVDTKLSNLLSHEHF